MREYIDVLAASAQEGVEKPDVRIYEMALKKAGCRACRRFGNSGYDSS